MVKFKISADCSVGVSHAVDGQLEASFKAGSTRQPKSEQEELLLLTAVAHGHAEIVEDSDGA